MVEEGLCSVLASLTVNRVSPRTDFFTVLGRFLHFGRRNIKIFNIGFNNRSYIMKNTQIFPPHQKVILCILDGWGISPASAINGITQAHLPNWDRFMGTYPHSQLEASELGVGLPEGQMGNSEVGHMTIGSGRVVFQDLPRMDLAIKNNTIPDMPVFQEFLGKAQHHTKTVHLMGLLSPGGVHSHENHLLYLANLFVEQGLKVNVHVFLDGRDTPPQSGADTFNCFRTALLPGASIVSVTGRYYAMDRDKRWERTQVAYAAMVNAVAPISPDFEATIRDHYAVDIGDEFIPPHISPEYEGMTDGDCLVMANFRADRVRQILSALLKPDFTGFKRAVTIRFAATLGMTEYSDELRLHIPALFVKESLPQTLGEVISQKGLRQFRTAETEKYAHVTFFLNGGREQVFEGEDRLMVPSPAVATYDLKPEMSAPEMTEALVAKIREGVYDLIVVNYANPDMVGHTGIQPAIKIALETVDKCLGDLEAAAKAGRYALLITADHGNVEQMVDEITGQPHTAHTLNPVPFMGINMKGDGTLVNGGLKDIAPTILDLMGIEKPQEMTGRSLRRV